MLTILDRCKAFDTNAQTVSCYNILNINAQIVWCQGPLTYMTAWAQRNFDMHGVLKPWHANARIR